MKDRKSNDDEFKVACKFATCTFEHLSKLNDSIENPLTEDEKPLKFGNQWIQMWEQKYNIGLRRLNKRCSISIEDRKRRIEDYFQNVWSVRNYSLQKYNVDPPIFNGDQMTLH